MGSLHVTAGEFMVVRLGPKITEKIGSDEKVCGRTGAGVVQAGDFVNRACEQNVRPVAGDVKLGAIWRTVLRNNFR